MTPQRELEITRVKMLVEPLGWDIVEIKSEDDTIRLGMVKKMPAPELEAEKKAEKLAGLPG